MVENSTEAVVVNSEAGDMIVFHAPNDGSIAEIITPNIEVNGGRIEYKKRDYHIVDEQGNKHGLILVGREKLNQIFHFFNLEMAKLSSAKEEAEKTLALARDKVVMFKRELMQLRKDIETIKNENRLYKELYGDQADPFLVLKELYKGGSIAKFKQLVKPEDFRQKSINTKNKKNREPVQYWLSKFEWWGIVDSEGNTLYARVTYVKAKKILWSRIMDKEIGYMKDCTTCKGGESLSEDDKTAITEELKEQWGGK